MAKIQRPVFTGDTFQVLEAERDGSRWTIKAKFPGGIERSFEIIGTSTHVLQALKALSEHPEKIPFLSKRPCFTIENSTLLGNGIIKAVTKVSPFHKKIFEDNISKE